MGLIVRPLLALRFIHFAHWSLVTHVPSRAPRGRSRRLPHPYLLFHSNFDGAVDQYIDAFSLQVPGRMWLCWGGAYGFPGPRPTGRFKRYILPHVVEDAHYFCVYPEASTKMILSALRVSDELARFANDQAELSDPGAFLAAWRQLLARVANDL